MLLAPRDQEEREQNRDAIYALERDIASLEKLWAAIEVRLAAIEKALTKR